MKKKEIVLLAVTALVVAALLYPKSQPLPQFSAQIKVRTIQESIQAVGIVAPVQMYTVTAPSTGRLRFFVAKNEKVSGKQALFEQTLLEQDDARSLLALAKQQGEEMDAARSAIALSRASTALAPDAGYVRGLYSYTGQTVPAGTPVLELCSAQKQITFTVADKKVERLTIGQKLTATRGSKKFSVQIAAIEPSATPGQYTVSALLPAHCGWMEGMQADIHILLQSFTGATLPIAAVKEQTVQCLCDGKLVTVPVKTGLCNAMYIALYTGPDLNTTVYWGEGDA